MTPAQLAARRLASLGCVLAVALGLALLGCGEEGTAAPGSDRKQPAKIETKVEEGTRPSPTGGCPRQVLGFVDSLETLRSQLAVGLSYKQYTAKVKGLRATYDRIPVSRLTIDCLTSTGTAGEQALNQHIDAVNAWGECLADASCTITTIEPVLQRKWRVASRYLSEAQ